MAIKERKPFGFHTTALLAKKCGKSTTTIWRWCSENRGFAIQIGNHFRIPDSHVKRLMAGETPLQIAASPSQQSWV